MADKNTKPVPFPVGARVMHPAHGVGTVCGVERFEASGLSVEVLHLVLDDHRMELRIPLGRLASYGLRPLSTPERFAEVLAVLGGRFKASRGVWAKRALDYQAKINSGDPKLVAEVIRDTGRNRGLSQSYSERQILEKAVDRLASEMAAVMRLARPEAAERILAHLPAIAPVAKTFDPEKAAA